MHVFTQNGTFVFYDNAEPSRTTIVTVKEKGSKCPDFIVAPTTELLLGKANIRNTEVRALRLFILTLERVDKMISKTTRNFIISQT